MSEVQQLPLTGVTVVTAAEVAANRKRGGDIRVMLSPKTVQSTSGFMGTLTLQPGDYVSEHYHPYSEEFLLVTRGRIAAVLNGEQELVVEAGQGVMIPKGLRHRVHNPGSEPAEAVFHLSPLAPRHELGHVDTEPGPASGASEPNPEVGGLS